MRWQWHRFADLGVDNLHDALQLRSRVFILEQGPFLDVDGFDRQSWHLLGRDESGTLQACLRVVDPGLKYEEPSIGRVVTAAEVRRDPASEPGSLAGRHASTRGPGRCGAPRRPRPRGRSTALRT